MRNSKFGIIRNQRETDQPDQPKDRNQCPHPAKQIHDINHSIGDHILDCTNPISQSTVWIIEKVNSENSIHRMILET